MSEDSQEVSFDQVKAEEAAPGATAVAEPEVEAIAPPAAKPVEDEPTKEEVKEVISEVEEIEPSTEPKTWILIRDGQAVEYVQAPLSFFAKIQFFGLLGETVSKAMEGDDGLTVVGMLDAMGGGRPTLDAESLGSADAFVGGIAKLTTKVPDFLKDCYCIWLNVPKKEREWAREALDNLDDAEGVEIIETFLDQNSEALADFFRETAPRLLGKVQARFSSDS